MTFVNVHIKFSLSKLDFTSLNGMWQNTVRNVCQLKKWGEIVHAHEMLQRIQGNRNSTASKAQSSLPHQGAKRVHTQLIDMHSRFHAYIVI